MESEHANEQSNGAAWEQSLWPVLWTVLVLALKLAWFYSLLPDIPVMPVWSWLGCLGLALGLLSLTLCLPMRVGLPCLWLISLGAGLVLQVDLIYYRTFTDFPSVSLLVGTHQLGTVREGIVANLSPLDLLLNLDLLIGPVLFLLLLRNGRGRTRLSRRRCLLFAVVVAGSAGYLLLGTGQRAHASIVARTNNALLVKTLGLPVFHLYDLISLGQTYTRDYKKAEPSVIKERLQLSRRSVSSEFPGFASQRGRNVVMITMESFNSFVLDLEVDGQEVTPFLNELKRTSLWGHGEDQAYQGGSSDADFVLMNSLHPPSYGPVAYRFAHNAYSGLPAQFARQGYWTLKAMAFDGSFWNARTAGRAYGFEEGRYLESFQPDPARTLGWGLTDEAIYEQVVPWLKASSRPFFVSVQTLVMHHPFQRLPKEQRPLKLNWKLEEEMIGRYLQMARLADDHLRGLVEELKAAGLWENTVLVLLGDHEARMPKAEYERLGAGVPKHLRDRVLILIHCPGGQPAGRLERGIGLIDVGPTLLHLFGFDPERTAFLGRNLLAGPKSAVTRRGWVTNPEMIQFLGSRLEVSPVYDLSRDEYVERPPSSELYQQGMEELRVSDTLIFGDRIKEFIPDRD